MANKYSIEIEGYQVREIRCKNDNCRALFGYEQMVIGVMVFTCSRCGQTSVFAIKYREVKKEFIENLKKDFISKGGEN